MAYIGTLLGAIIAIPFSVLATRTFSGQVISTIVRTLLAAIRTIPSLLWALLFIVLVGLGPLPGMLGLTAYTVGYLGKLYYEAFEGVDPEVLEAVRATGTSRWQLVRHAVIPEAANPLLSQLLFIFEYNVRASSILGLVGAGGIGFYIWEHVTTFRYDAVATDILLLLIVVLAIDLASGRLRRRYLIESQPGIPA